MMTVQEAFAAEQWKVRGLYYGKTRVSRITVAADGWYALLDADGRVFAVLRGEAPLLEHGEVGPLNDVPSYSTNSEAAIALANNFILLNQRRDEGLPNALDGPIYAPDGPIALPCSKPLLGVPIYDVKVMVSHNTWFMVEQRWAEEYLIRPTLNTATMSPFADPGSEYTWYCWRAIAVSFYALFWDYTPLCDVYGLSTDDLEKALVGTEFLTKYYKEYGNDRRAS